MRQQESNGFLNKETYKYLPKYYLLISLLLFINNINLKLIFLIKEFRKKELSLKNCKFISQNKDFLRSQQILSVYQMGGAGRLSTRTQLNCHSPKEENPTPLPEKPPAAVLEIKIKEVTIILVQHVVGTCFNMSASGDEFATFAIATPPQPTAHSPSQTHTRAQRLRVGVCVR